MSFESRRINNEYDNSTVKYEHNPEFGIIVYQISSMVFRIQQLENDLEEQHQYDKDTLNELNQRLYILIDRIQFLQSENLKYIVIIANIRQNISDYNTNQIEEDYSLFWSNILSISNEKIDYDWDYQMFQLHIQIYQNLISIEDNKSKNNQIGLLEKQLDHSKSILINLHTSYEQLQQDINQISIHNQDLLKQYFQLITEWCHLKRKQNKYQLKIEKIKNYITFYQKLRLYTTE
jgi:hypothetical protein